MFKHPSLSLSLGACLVLLSGGCGAAPQQRPAHGTSQTSTPALQGTPSQLKQIADVADEGDPIWGGKSGGFDLRWTTADLYVQSAAGTEQIFSPIAKSAFNEAGDEGCDLDREFKVLSVVGSLVSFQDEESSYCGGLHPSYAVRFTTIDLAKPGGVQFAEGAGAAELDVDLAKSGRVVKLTDYFAEQDVLRALSDDKVVRGVLADLGVSTQPQNLAELQRLFAENVSRVGSVNFELRPDYLTRFVFHHVEGDKVAVRIGLPPFTGAGRGQHQQIGLLLPIPPALQQPLNMAASGQEGFLLENAPKIVTNQQTKFSFSARGNTKRKKKAGHKIS